MLVRPSRALLSLLLAALFGASALLAPAAALARPAYSQPVTVTDASGTEMQIRGCGDEFFNYSMDIDGRLVVKDAAGYYRYVGEENGALTALGRVAAGATADAVMPSDVKGLKDKLTALRLRLEQSGLSLATNDLGRRDIPPNYDINESDGVLKGRIGTLTGAEVSALKKVEKSDTCPLLVLMVDFNDVKCLFTEQEWATRIFDDGVSSYYIEVSNGQFTYEPAAESCGTNNGVIKVTLPFNRPLYTAHGAGNLQHGLYTGTDQKIYTVYNTGTLFAHALRAAESSLDDTRVAEYDRNGDGYISPTELAVILVLAGYDASSGGEAVGLPAEWPHSGTFHSSWPGCTNWDYLSVQAAGKKFFKYTCMADNMDRRHDYSKSADATAKRQAQFGTACHELGHDLGLMDLYDVNSVKGA